MRYSRGWSENNPGLPLSLGDPHPVLGRLMGICLSISSYIGGAELGLWPLQRPISDEWIYVTGLPGKRSSDLLCLPIFIGQTLPSRQLQGTDLMSPRARWRQHVHSWLRQASTSTLLDPEWSDWWPGMGQCLLYDSLRHERTEFYNIVSFYFKENGFIHL